MLPRSRLADGEFRKWVQTHEPPWELVWDRPDPRRKGGPRDRWSVCRAPLPSREPWPVIWVWSPLLALCQEQSGRERLAAAQDALSELRTRLASPKTRHRTAREVDRRIVVRSGYMPSLVRSEASAASSSVRATSQRRRVSSR